MRAFKFAVLVLALPLCLAVTAAPEEETAASLWEFDPGAEGVVVTELLVRVHEVTGENILFNPYDPAIKNKRVDLTGPIAIPETRVFDWLRSVLAYQHLVLVPTGPREARQWAILNATDPSVARHAVHVAAEDLSLWADRDGAFIMTVFTVKHMADTTRARTALANLVTRPCGRIQDVPGTRSFVISDYAPVVAAIGKMIERMDVKTNLPAAAFGTPRRGATSRVAPKPPSPRQQYEQMLVGSRTETAARYFMNRLEEIRKTEDEDG